MSQDELPTKEKAKKKLYIILLMRQGFKGELLRSHLARAMPETSVFLADDTEYMRLILCGRGSEGLLVLDSEIAPADAREILAEVRSKSRTTKWVLIGTQLTYNNCLQAIASCATGVLTWNMTGAAVVDALRLMLAGAISLPAPSDLHSTSGDKQTAVLDVLPRNENNLAGRNV